MRRRGWTLVAGALVVFVLSAGLAKAPVPYVALAPGRAVDTLGMLNGDSVIHIDGAEVAPSDGQLSFTTVSVYDGIDLFTAIRMWFDDDVAVVPREQIYPPGQSRREAQEESDADFVNSQASAEAAALREIGYDTQLAVAKLQKGSPARDSLRSGDLLLTIDDVEVETGTEFLAKVGDHQPGSKIRIGYKRDGVDGVAEFEVKADPKDKKKGHIGVTLEQRQPHDFTVSFDVAGVGGPSAGLMFSLGIIDKLDSDDLTGGHNIAGTGTIDDAGTVGPIGGIPQKMVAARKTGAEYFLAPQQNCAEARKTKPAGLRLVKVADLDDALNALAMVREGKTPPSC